MECLGEQARAGGAERGGGGKACPKPVPKDSARQSEKVVRAGQKARDRRVVATA